MAILYIVLYAIALSLQVFMIAIDLSVNIQAVALTMIYFVFVVVANLVSLRQTSIKMTGVLSQKVASTVSTLAGAGMCLSVYLLGEEALVAPDPADLRPLMTSFLFQVLMLLTVHAQLGTVSAAQRGQSDSLPSHPG